MPSFLSKVFSRKNSRDGGDSDVVGNGSGGDGGASGPKSPRGHKSNPSLLEGKFEAVITPASPLSSNFAEANTNHIFNQQQKPDKETGIPGFTLFRTKSRPANSSLSPTKRIGELPTLSFNYNYEKGTPTSTSSPFSPFSQTSTTSPISLSSPSASRVLGVVFEGDDRHILLDERVIGATRLSPAEALVLVRSCSLVIAERGLETLGIMHPHWHSASPEIQRRLISLFILSLGPPSIPKSQIITPTTTSDKTQAQTAFESELKSTRSPHDVAAVLRWGLRHLKLEGDSFGLPSPSESDWSWYTTFFLAERSPPSPSQPYQLNAYTTHLPPVLPSEHFVLLTATLEILSSLAAHAEGNGMGGSKLCKGVGWWVCCGGRDAVESNTSEPGRVGRAGKGGVVVKKESLEGWEEFYRQWEKAGRVLEHLFLARIRDEGINHRMPTRLMELVRYYPYHKGPSPSTADSDNKDITWAEDKVEGEEELFLSRPRFSTRTYDALFIRIDTELPHSPTNTPSTHSLTRKSSKTSKTSTTSTATINQLQPKPKRGHLRLLAEAFNVDLVSELETDGEDKGEAESEKYYLDVWEKIRKAALLEGAGDNATEAEDTKSKKVPVLNRVFADETIRLLSLVPNPHITDGNGDDVGVELAPGGLGVGVGGRVGRSATASTSGAGSGKRRSSSLSHVPDYRASSDTSAPNGNEPGVASPSKPAALVPLPPSPVIDWAQFTSAGFGAGTSDDATAQHLFLTGLLDHEDVEVTKPPPVPLSSGSSAFPAVPLSFPSPLSVVRKVSRGKDGKWRDSSRRSSADSPNHSSNSIPDAEAEVIRVGKSKATCVKHIQLDEAFVDFWSDAVLDPISASWPTFVVCKLNPGFGVSSGEDGGQQTEINWLVVEQTYSSPPVPRVPSSSLERNGSGKRASSPRPSLRSDLSRMSASFSASTRKRFSFFGGGSGGGVVASGKVEKTKAKGVGRKSSVQGVRVGEMGEVLPDVVEKPEGTGVARDVAVTAVVTPAAAAAAEAVKSAKPEDGGDSAPVEADELVGVVGATADKEVTDSKEETTAHAVIMEADDAKETERDAVDTPSSAAVAESTLPPAPERVVLSGNTPGPQVALDTSELAAVATEPTPTPTPPPFAADATATLPVEDMPGPQVVSDTEPAKIEPLKVQDELTLPTTDEVIPIPVVVAEESSSALHPEPEPEPALEPSVDASPPSPVAAAPTMVVEPANESPAHSIELVEEVIPEPVKEVTAEPPAEETYSPPTEAVESHPESEPESAAPAVPLSQPATPKVTHADVTSYEAEETTSQSVPEPDVEAPHEEPTSDEVEEAPESASEPEPAAPESLHDDAASHEAKEAPVQAVSEPEPVVPEGIHEEVASDEAEQAADQTVSEPEPEALDTPGEEAQPQAAEETSEASEPVSTLTAEDPSTAQPAASTETIESPSTEPILDQEPEQVSAEPATEPEFEEDITNNDPQHAEAEAASEPHAADEAS